ALAAAEHLVLDADRPKVTRPHAEERQPGRCRVAGLGLEAAVGQADGPELLPRRMQELLPRSGTRGVAERGAVAAAPQAVAPWFELDAPPEGQLPGGLQFVEDDRTVAHRGPDHGEPRAVQCGEQLPERRGIYQLHAAGLAGLIHALLLRCAPLSAVSGRSPSRLPGTRTGRVVPIVARHAQRRQAALAAPGTNGRMSRAIGPQAIRGTGGRLGL